MYLYRQSNTGFDFNNLQFVFTLVLTYNNQYCSIALYGSILRSINCFSNYI